MRTDLKDPKLKERDFNISLEFTQEHLLDRWNVDYALPTGPPPFYGYSSLPDPDSATALCTALNDRTLDNWLERDNRVVNATLVSPSDPTQAVAEIKRLALRKNTVAVMIPMGTAMPFGNRFYHPIGEACAEHGLPVVSHIGGGGGATRTTPSPVGFPTYSMEARMATPHVASTHAASLICEGIFEKFSDLKFALIEVQQLWAVSVMWHYQMLEMLHTDETLVLCTDFPHFDWNDPVTVFTKLPDHVHQRIFVDNAMEMLRIR